MRSMTALYFLQPLKSKLFGAFTFPFEKTANCHCQLRITVLRPVILCNPA
jgi:hypothetical protein